LVVLALTAAPGRAGDIAGAKAAGIEWQNKWFKAIAYWHIAEGQAKVGDKQGALQTIAPVKQSADGIEDKSQRGEVHANIARRQASEKDFTGARQTAELIMDAASKAGCYEIIAKAQADAGDGGGARETNAMKEQAENEAKAEKAAWDEIWPWAGKFENSNAREKAILPDWQVYGQSLKGKKPDEATADVVKLIGNLAESFYSLRLQEAQLRAGGAAKSR
jgi:hypothetical protein